MYKLVIVSLLLVVAVMGYKIHELRDDSLSRFTNCFEPEIYLTDRAFCKKNLEKMGVTFDDEDQE